MRALRPGSFPYQVTIYSGNFSLPSALLAGSARILVGTNFGAGKGPAFFEGYLHLPRNAFEINTEKRKLDRQMYSDLLGTPERGPHLFQMVNNLMHIIDGISS